MNSHPLNLGVRFLLEIALIVIFAYWAWNNFDGIIKYVMTVVLPLSGILVWAIFKVDGDPGKAIVAINGWTRLILELVLFGSAFFMLRAIHLNRIALVLLLITFLHYLASYDRVKWLLLN